MKNMSEKADFHVKWMPYQLRPRAPKGVGVERPAGVGKELREQIAAVQRDFDLKHAAHSGELLAKLQEQDAKVRSEIAGLADSHGAKLEQQGAALRVLLVRAAGEGVGQ